MEHVCPTCAVAMVEGFLPDYSHGRTYVEAWVEGAPEFTAWGNAKTEDRPRYALQAFRCPTCGLIQFYATKRDY